MVMMFVDWAKAYI